MSHEEQAEETLDDVIAPPLLSAPRIFAKPWTASLSSEFDGVTLSLNGRVESDLDWKATCGEARQAIEKGYQIMWEIDLGFFKALKQPLTHQGQFLSFILALEHFRDFIWPEFGSKTLGLSLLQGSADFSQAFPWTLQQEDSLANWLHEHQFSELASLSFSSLQLHPMGKQLLPLFCRDVAMDYLTLLAARLPEAIPVYLLLDASPFTQEVRTQIQCLHPERFNRFRLILKGATLPFEAIGWDKPTTWGYRGEIPALLPSPTESSIGLCLPPLDCCQVFHYQGLEEVIAILRKKELPFKLIAENQLTLQWSGLDFLFYFSSGLSVQGKRKLQGFCAAGGIPVAVQERSGLSNEQDLKTWMANHG